LGGCSSNGPTHDGLTGSATFPLTTTSSQGTAFRLASAQFQINGPESTLLAPGDDEAVAFAELVPGAYVSRLLDSWRLQRDAGGAWQDVVAQLEDDPEKPFSIAAGNATEISYRFTVNNDAVEFGTGSLRIGVEVNEAKACQLLFTEDFADNSAGWELGWDWAIGPAKESPFLSGFHGDPGFDHTATDDNGVAGVIIGGNTAAGAIHDWYYLTSPAIDVSSAAGNVYLSFQRWLNSDYLPYMESSVEVFDGEEWDLYWHTGDNPQVRDNHWTPQEFDLGTSGSNALRIRFGYSTYQAGVLGVSSWNLDDIKLYSTECP
jgi:hypothetical protein